MTNVTTKPDSAQPRSETARVFPLVYSADLPSTRASRGSRQARRRDLVATRGTPATPSQVREGEPQQ
jgi:hypothetical protein